MTARSTLSDAPDTGLFLSVSDAGIGPNSREFLLAVHPFGAMPVRVDVDEDGSFLAVELVTSAYGVGVNYSEALAALAAAIRRHYEFLRREGQDRLSPRLFQQLKVLDAQKAMATRGDARRGGTPGAMQGNRQLALAA
jgi:hypothetical protein